jgi:hypothetical protein
MREIKLKPDGAWHLTREEVDWLNGAADREAALRAQVEELTLERNALKEALESACLISGAAGPHAEPDQCREQIVNVLGTLTRLKNQAEQKLASAVNDYENWDARLAAVLEVLEGFVAASDGCNYGGSEACPGSPEFKPCRYHAGLAALAAAREQPTQEPPPGNLWCNFHNKHRKGPEAQCPDCAREQPTQEKLPLGHEFWKGQSKHDRCRTLDVNGIPCCEPKAAHQPTQEKP